MRAFKSIAVLFLAAGVAAVLFGVRNELASADHSPPGTVDTHIVHVHDVYYHPEPLTGPWPDHTAAQADCEVADPPALCDMNIEVGDSVEWWTKSPFHLLPHTVTECTDNTFSSCGATADPANPIGDSNVFSGGASANTLRYGPITFTTAGTFYYYCSIHPDVMRGRIVVAAAQQTPSPTPSPAPTTSPVGSPTASPTGTAAASPTASPLPAAAPQTGGSQGGSGTNWPWIAVAMGAAIITASSAMGVQLLRRR
jgi:plastocyanin